MNFETPDMPLLTVQEQHMANAPRLYRPHTSSAPKAFDWDALTPTCTECGSKTGQVNTFSGLCPTCDPTTPAAPPTPRTKPAARGPARATSGRRPRGPQFELDMDAIIEAYVSGQSANGIATALRVKPDQIRRALVLAGVEVRDDRGRGGGRPRTRPVRTPQPRRTYDEQAIVTAYQAGATAPELAREHSCTPKKIRTILDEHRIPRRDDRATRSGGRKVERDPQLIAQIRRLYLDERLSQTEVAEQLSTSRKVICSIMIAAGIPARQGENGRKDGAAPLKALIAEIGVPSAEIKAWGLRNGLLMEIGPGIPPRRVVDAYIAAHGLQVGAA